MDCVKIETAALEVFESPVLVGDYFRIQTNKKLNNILHVEHGMSTKRTIMSTLEEPNIGKYFNVQCRRSTHRDAW